MRTLPFAAANLRTANARPVRSPAAVPGPTKSQGIEPGQLNRAFEHALRGGDLRMTLAVAADLQVVSLERAPRLPHLMAAKQSLLFDEAALGGSPGTSARFTERPPSKKPT